MPFRTSASRTADLIAVRRAIGEKHRRRRIPRPVLPDAIERGYATELRAIVARVRESLQPLLNELPALLASHARESGRTDAHEGKRILTLIEAATASVAPTIQPTVLEELARKFAARTATHQRIQMNRQTQAALGIDVLTTDRTLTALMDGFVTENVSLIKDLPRKMYGDIERTVSRGVGSGRLHRDLAKDIEKQFGLGEKRARLIARDQVGKFYGQVQQARQRELGVDAYIWRTVGDERVRDEHEERNGQRFLWSDPPDDGHPGEPVLCRCSAEPDFSAILNAAAE